MSICIAHHRQYKCLMHSRDHLSYVITQCYLPPGRGDSPDFTLPFTSTHFTVLWKVEGWVDLGTAVRVHSPCPRLYIPVVDVINTRPQCASILGPNTPQSSVLPLDHCDLQINLSQPREYPCCSMSPKTNSLIGSGHHTYVTLSTLLWHCCEIMKNFMCH